MTDVAVLTGGTGSVGRALIPTLISRGFRIGATYLVPEEATALEDELDLDEEELLLRRVDATDAQAVDKFMQEAVERLVE